MVSWEGVADRAGIFRPLVSPETGLVYTRTARRASFGVRTPTPITLFRSLYGALTHAGRMQEGIR
jgi:hypothetical protein